MPIAHLNFGQGVVGLDGTEDGDQVISIPELGIRVTTVSQYLCGEQTKHDTKQQPRIRRLVVFGVGRCLEHVDQKTVQFGVKFALDHWQQAEIDEIELIALVDGTDRFRTMDGVWTPLVQISLEQSRHIANAQTFA